jgi:hypothetical protein
VTDRVQVPRLRQNFLSAALRDARLPAVRRMPAQQTAAPSRRNWIVRHPTLFGALVGFGGGFAIGYGAGDDGVFDDYVASFNGLVLGGIGAGVGAGVGAAFGK